MSTPKVIPNDPVNNIEPEFQLFLNLIISETTYLRNFQRIFYRFENYERYRIFDPFSIALSLSKNKTLRELVLYMFSLDTYLCERNYKTRQNILFFNIPRVSERRGLEFIDKFKTTFDQVNALIKINSHFSDPIPVDVVDASKDIPEKIKEITRVKLGILKTIDQNAAIKTIKKLNQQDFLELL